MKHFVCLGNCAEESEKPGVCQSEGCDKEGSILSECNCEDGVHDEVNVAPEVAEEDY